MRGDGDSADKHREFYDEYLAVMDLTAEFYMQTVDTVFVQHLMPRGLMTSRGRPIDLSAIRRPALMTVEGEKDDITGTGQCRAALDLCTGIPDEHKVHFECPKVGHYGVFNGSRFRTEIAPRMAKFMRAHDPCASTDLTIAQLEHMATMPRRGRRRAGARGTRLQLRCRVRRKRAIVKCRCGSLSPRRNMRPRATVIGAVPTTIIC